MSCGESCAGVRQRVHHTCATQQGWKENGVSFSNVLAIVAVAALVFSILVFTGVIDVSRGAALMSQSVAPILMMSLSAAVLAVWLIFKGLHFCRPQVSAAASAA